MQLLLLFCYGQIFVEDDPDDADFEPATTGRTANKVWYLCLLLLLNFISVVTVFLSIVIPSVFIILSTFFNSFCCVLTWKTYSTCTTGFCYESQIFNLSCHEHRHTDMLNS